MNKNGFTFIELLLVLAILGFIITFVMIRFVGPEKAARDTRRQSDIREYQNALEIYANKNNGLYPAGNMSAISLCPILGLGSTCPDDPKTANHYQYLADSGSNSSRYLLYATLEKPTPVEYFGVCSNGKVLKQTRIPTLNDCQ